MASVSTGKSATSSACRPGPGTSTPMRRKATTPACSPSTTCLSCIRLASTARKPLATIKGGSRSHHEHDPEKWEPVFGEDHAQTKEEKHDDVCHHALGKIMRLVTYRGSIEAAARLGVVVDDLVIDVEKIGAHAGVSLPS